MSASPPHAAAGATAGPEPTRGVGRGGGVGTLPRLLLAAVLSVAVVTFLDFRSSTARQPSVGARGELALVSSGVTKDKGAATKLARSLLLSSREDMGSWDRVVEAKLRNGTLLEGDDLLPPSVLRNQRAVLFGHSSGSGDGAEEPNIMALPCPSAQRPCRSCLGGPTVGCVDGCRCDLPRCIVVRNKCVVNVFDASADNLNIRNETVCVGKEHSDPLPDAKDQDPVATFKRLTAWAFDHWWDWDVTCDPDSAEKSFAHGGRLVARHDAELDYVMENVCLRPAGSIQGYQPQTEPFRGRDEVWSYEGTEMQSFLASIEPLPHPPSCLVDADLILMFMDKRIPNSGHAFARYVTTELLRQFHFPRSGDPVHPMRNTTNQATSAYRHSEWEEVASNVPKEEDKHGGKSSPMDGNDGGNKTNTSRTSSKTSANKSTNNKRRPVIIGFVAIRGFDWRSGNGFRNYYPAMGDAWFSTFGVIPTIDDIRKARLEGKIPANFDVLKSNSTLCFRKARVAFACYETECTKPFADIPGRRYHAGFFEYRNGYTHAILPWVRNVFAKCLGVKAKPTADTENPLVVVSYRTKSRFVQHLSSNAYALAEHFIKKHHARTVVITEHVRLSPLQVMRLHINADIVMGTFGAGLGWSVFSPPNAVLLETVGTDFGCPGANGLRHQGVFRPANCEFAGWAAAMGRRHYNVIVPIATRHQYRVTENGWKFLADRAVCALRWNNGTGVALPTKPDEPYTEGTLRSAYAGLVQACERPFRN